MARALDLGTDDNSSRYPCQVLNRFACPYDMQKSSNNGICKSGNNLDIDYLFSLSDIGFAVELALGKAQNEDSKIRIRSVKDVYDAITDKEILEKILEQGLKEEHKQYKDQILEFFMDMKDRIKIEDLTRYLP